MTDRSLLRYGGVVVCMAIAIGYTSYRSTGSLLSAMAAGTTASVISTFVVARLNRRAARRMAEAGVEGGDHPVRVRALARVAGDPSAVFDACKAAIENLPNFASVRELDTRALTLEARTRRSSTSWGEKIAVRVHAHGNQSELQVSSLPALWTVTQDMGWNYQNVALVLKTVNRSVPILDVEPSSMLAEVREV